MLPCLLRLVSRLPREQEGLRYAGQRARGRRAGAPGSASIRVPGAAGQRRQQRQPQLLGLRRASQGGLCWA